MTDTTQAAKPVETPTFQPIVAKLVDLRSKPYATKRRDAAGEPIKVNGLALLVGDVKIDYFGSYGGWERWQALGEAIMRFGEDPELAIKVGTAIQKAYIAYVATTNGTKKSDVGASLL